MLSRDGASIELRPTAYEFSAIPQAAIGTDWDANWLLIRGEVKTADGLEWTFIDPCLTTWEVRKLAAWLRDVAGGRVVPTADWSEEGEGLLYFTEPNMAFSLEERSEERTRVRVHFSLALPPWLRERNQLKLFEYFLVLDLRPEDLTTAAEEWDNDCEPFPER